MQEQGTSNHIAEVDACLYSRGRLLFCFLSLSVSSRFSSGFKNLLSILLLCPSSERHLLCSTWEKHPIHRCEAHLKPIHPSIVVYASYSTCTSAKCISCREVHHAHIQHHLRRTYSSTIMPNFADVCCKQRYAVPASNHSLLDFFVEVWRQRSRKYDNTGQAKSGDLLICLDIDCVLLVARSDRRRR
jgi:hypothetical protein